MLDSSVKEKEKLISTCNAKVKEITEVYEADNESAKKNKRKYEALLSQEEELIQSTINEKTEEIKRQLEEQSQLEIKNKKNLMDKKYKYIENLNEWVLLFCLIWSGVQAIVNKWIRADLIEIALIVRRLLVNSFSFIVKTGYSAGNIINVGETNSNIVLQGVVHVIVWIALFIIVYGLPLFVILKLLKIAIETIDDETAKTLAIANVVMIGFATLIRFEPKYNLLAGWLLIKLGIIGLRHLFKRKFLCSS